MSREGKSPWVILNAYYLIKLGTFVRASTHATRLIQNGLNLYEVKEILGHADIKTTMRYAHIEQRTVSIKAREVIDRLNKENQKPELRLIK